MRAEEFYFKMYPKNKWSHPITHGKTTIVEFAEAYAKHVIEKALPEIFKRKRECYNTMLGDIWTDNATEIQVQKDFINQFKENLKKEGIEI